MSDAGGKKIKLWAGILDEGPTPDARIEAVKAEVESNLVEFDQHIEDLLDHLRTVSGNSRSFGQERARLRLTRLAQAYFLRQVTTPALDRVARLRKLADALGQTRDLAETVRQDHGGIGLFSIWFDGLPRDPRGKIVLDDDGSLRVVHFAELDLKEMVTTLGSYHAATLRAAEDVPTPTPGPTPVLPGTFIGGLADAYQDLTGRKPGAGVGPFYRFVMKFRAALDPSYKTKDESGDERVDESTIEAIKKALRHWRRGRGYSAK